LLMLGRDDEARDWLVRAAETYWRSWPDAPPGRWGRPIGAMKARLIAGDLEGGRADARGALGGGAASSESAVARAGGALAALVLGADGDAEAGARTLEGAETIPTAVVDSLLALAGRDARAYEAGTAALVADFEARDEFLEDIRVADTVLAFQALAAER